MAAGFIPFAVPSIGSKEIEAVTAVLRSGWITTGPRVQEFTKKIQAYLGAPDALALSSCTAALHTALVTLGIGPGDEVITSPLTFAATANVIEHVGARPVFADVEPDTLCLDPASFKSKISRRTRAVIPVHFAGHPAEMDPIRQIARSKNLAVIEDAAHALPAKYRGQMVGSTPNFVAFSFYATKNLATAEGGLLTGPPKLLQKARPLALHGMTRDAWKRYGPGGSWFYEITAPGYKYNLTDIQAALGLVQLSRLDSFQRRRVAIVRNYDAAFGSMPELEIPVAREHVTHAWHLYILRLNTRLLKIGRDEFIERLSAAGIGTSVHFIPVHTHPYYRKKYHYAPRDFPVAYSNYQRMLSLPLHPGLSPANVKRIIATVKRIVETERKN